MHVYKSIYMCLVALHYKTWKILKTRKKIFPLDVKKKKKIKNTAGMCSYLNTQQSFAV